MKLSARNVLAPTVTGTVTEVTMGQTTAQVKIRLEGGATVTASITNGAAPTRRHQRGGRGPGPEGGRRGLGDHQGVRRHRRQGIGARPALGGPRPVP